MLTKAISQTKKENANRALEQKLIEGDSEANKDLIERSPPRDSNNDGENQPEHQFEVNKDSRDKGPVTNSEDTVETKAPFCQLFKKAVFDVILCVCSYLVILVVAFLRGGHGMTSVIGIGYCSAAGWGFFVLAQLACVG